MNCIKREFTKDDAGVQPLIIGNNSLMVIFQAIGTFLPCIFDGLMRKNVYGNSFVNEDIAAISLICKDILDG